jgi:hypothetical protein
MLLSEMVRKVTKEAILHQDTTSYTSPTAHDWATRKSKTITLSEPSLVFVRFKGKSGGSNPMGSLRLLHNNNPVLVYQLMPLGSEIQHSLFMYLPAGNHTFALQTAVYRSPNNNETAIITEFYIAVLGFADTGGQESVSSTIEVPASGTSIIISLPFTVPSARKLAVGTVKQYPCIITVYCEISNSRGSVLMNPEEADASSSVNWRLYLDGNEIGWKERQNDSYDLSYNPSYSEGCYGRHYVALEAGTSHTLMLKATNTLSATKTVKAVINIVLCPWFLIDSHQPISLNFPQGSTLYLVLEPLWQDPTKTIKLGWKRFVSFGDATDYYSTASGTGVLSWNYTFESVEVRSCALLVGGYGGCISIIAVDVR